MPPPITTCNKNVYKLLKSSVTTLIPYTVVSAVLRCIAVNRPLAPAVLQFRPVDSPTKPITKLHWLAPVFSSYHCSMSETTASVNVTDPRAITRDVFSATLGSVCCCYTGQPFDTVKVGFKLFFWIANCGPEEKTHEDDDIISRHKPKIDPPPPPPPSKMHLLLHSKCFFHFDFHLIIILLFFLL